MTEVPSPVAASVGMHREIPPFVRATLRGEWRHRGCIVHCDWRSDFRRADGLGPFAICHASGLPMGQADSLSEARQMIDEGVLLVRQRLAAST